VPGSPPSARNGRWVALDGPQGSKWIPAVDPELFAGFIAGGIHGDEFAGPEIVVEVCEMLLTALAAKAAGGAPAAFSPMTSAEIDDIVTRLELYTVPLVCPYGRDKSSRPAKSGINLNRNFPFLWSMHYAANTYYGPLAPTASVVDPTGTPAAGASAMSEEETQCVVQLHMALEANLYLDCHTDQPESARYPWACDGTQTTVLADNWATPPAKRADAAPAAYAATVVKPPAVASTYDEYMPASALATLKAGAAALAAKTRLAGKAWITGSGLIESVNPLPPNNITATIAYIGASDDFAFSLDICNMRVYTLESGEGDLVSMEDNGAGALAAPSRRRYYIAILSLLAWYAGDAKAGRVARTISRTKYHRNNAANWAAYLAALPCIPAVGGGGGAPAPAPGAGGGGGGSTPGSGGGGTHPNPPPKPPPMHPTTPAPVAAQPAPCKCCGGTPCTCPSFDVTAHGHRGAFHVTPSLPEQVVFVASQPGVPNTPVTEGRTGALVTLSNRGPSSVRVHADGPLPSRNAPAPTLLRAGCSSTVWVHEAVKIVYEGLAGPPAGDKADGHVVISWCCGDEKGGGR
jgi:hypothetical protein